MKRGKRIRSVRDLVLPHAGNGYKPHALRTSAVALVIVSMLALEGIALFGSQVTINGTTMLASVLPSALTEYTNEDRLAADLPELTPDPLLAKAATLKAEDMARKGYFAHYAPDGTSPWHWLDEVHYPYSYAGENLAIDFSDSKDVVDAWMASPTHRANIMKPQYTHIGIGTAKGVYEGRETTFVVQYFATPKKGVQVPGHEGVVAGAGAQVLGAEIAPLFPDSFADFLARIAASPFSTLATVLTGVAGLFALLLIVAIVVHARIQFVEVIVGGLLVILAALGLIVWNASLQDVQVPEAAPETAIVQP